MPAYFFSDSLAYSFRGAMRLVNSIGSLDMIVTNFNRARSRGQSPRAFFMLTVHGVWVTEY